MPNRLFFISLLAVIFVQFPVWAAPTFVNVSGGAGATATSGALNTYNNGPCLDLAGGWELGQFQVKGEVGYFFNIGSQNYATTHTRDLAGGLFLGPEVGWSPFQFLTLTAGFGLSDVLYEDNWNSSGVDMKEEITIAGFAWIAGADFYFIHTDRLDMGIMGRMYQFGASDYADQVNASGATVSTSVPGSTTNTSWFALGTLRVHIK